MPVLCLNKRTVNMTGLRVPMWPQGSLGTACCVENQKGTPCMKTQEDLMCRKGESVVGTTIILETGVVDLELWLVVLQMQHVHEHSA